MQIDVRLAAIETKHEFATIVKDADAWQKALGSEGWNGPFDDAWMMPRIDRGELYLGYAGDTPVAACRLLWEDRPFWGDREEGDSVYLHTFAVRRSSAGLGIGGAIIDWVMGMGRQRGRTSVRLDCFLSNARLIAFYERNGFASVGIALTGGKTMNLMERMID